MHIDACRLICGLLAKLALRFDCECGNWQKAFSVTAASSLLDLAINTLKWVSDFWPKTEAPQKKSNLIPTPTPFLCDRVFWCLSISAFSLELLN